jgi:hypothetical protein
MTFCQSSGIQCSACEILNSEDGVLEIYKPKTNDLPWSIPVPVNIHWEKFRFWIDYRAGNNPRHTETGQKYCY